MIYQKIWTHFPVYVPVGVVHIVNLWVSLSCRTKFRSSVLSERTQMHLKVPQMHAMI